MKLKYFFIALVAMVACFSEAFAQQVITVSNAEELKQALKEAGAAPQARQAAPGAAPTYSGQKIQLTEYSDATKIDQTLSVFDNKLVLDLNGYVVYGNITIEEGQLSIIDNKGTGAWIGCITVMADATLAVGSGNVIAGESGVAVINEGKLQTDGGAVIGKITNTGSITGVATDNTALVANTTVAQAALNAAIDGQVIQFASNIEGDLTAVQKPNTKITIDGASKTLKGTITVDGKSAAYATAGLTIKNVNFNADGITADACVRLGDGTNATRYTNGVTVDGCTFTGKNKEKVGVKNYTGGCKNVTIINSTATGMHSLAQLKTSTTVTLSNNTVTECKNAISLGSSTGVTISECTINVDGYGVRADGGSNVTVTSSAIEAFIPVVVRNASVDSNITFEGTNSMTETNEDGIWFAAGTSEYEENGKLPTEATGKVFVTLNDTGLDAEGVYGDYIPVAKIGDVEYTSIQKAVNAVQDGETITFIVDIEENVTIVQAPDMAFTIDGAGYKMNGTITIDGKSAAYATAGLTIKNVKFNADGITADACVRLGDGTNATRYTNGVTVDGCTFTGKNKEKVGVKNYTGGCKNVTIINSTATGMHSLAQLKTSTTVTLSNNTVTECKNAISLGSSTGVTISECTINVDGYGVRADGGSNVTVTSSAIEAFIPVVVRKASVDSNLTFNGTNTMNQTNTDGFWCVIGTEEYEEGVELQTPATSSKVSVVLNDKDLDIKGVYGNYGVAQIGNVNYPTLVAAIEAVQDGETITLLDNTTMDYGAREAYKAQVQKVIINGNDKTLTLNQTNSDWSSFGLANNATLVLSNMTINKSGKGATSGTWNTHAIIFSCPVEMTDVTVNNSVAVQAGAVLNDVDINEANGYYGLWINGNGQEVVVNGGSITATNGGRGIKIADEYVNAPAQVTLSVDGTVFNTAKKAAVLVSSTAGAKISAANVNIENVAEDKVNFVWVDEDWAQYFGNVEVTGATVRTESIESFAAAITKNGVAKAYYKTLAAALTAAEDGDVITLNWAEGYAPIAMNGSVYGKKVTITGTATVDWSKGFLFVGRGGEGDATVTFDGANLTSASNSGSYGIHVSGREKNTNNKYDGTVVIKNSTIVLDYLINKGAMTLDNSTLTVKNGFSVGGRPASETESGADATATIALTNGSKVVVNNHNGMGLGYEAIGVMDVDATSTFETTQSFLVTAKGTMNIAGKAVVASTLTNNGAIVLTNTAATLQSSECGNVTTNVPDYKIAYADGTYKVVAKEYVAVIDESRKFESFAEAIAVVQNGETITFVADVTENVTIVQAPDMAFTINGAGYKMNGTITIDGKSAAYATAGLTIKNVKFNADGITADACVRLGDGTNATRYTNGVTVDGCTFTGKNKEKVGVKNYTGGCKNVTIINSTATGMHSLAQLKTSTTVTLSNNTVTECKNAISLGSSTGVTISECTINVDGYGVRADGGSNVTVTSSAIEAFIPVVVRNASVDSNITFEGTNSMTENNQDGFWCVIGTEEYEENGKLPEAATANVSVVLNGKGLDFNGVYGNYGVASIGNTKYFKFADAIAAAKAGDVITMLQDITEDVTVSKDVTIDGADKTYTGKMTLTSKNGTVAIKNVNFDGKGYNGYAVETRGVYYVTIEDCTAKNYGYGFVQLASSTVLTTVKNVTVSDMNYGVKVDYSSAVVLENVDITAAVAAVLNSNYGEKTITVKNSKLNILGTWKRNDTTKTTYVFEGENTVDEFKTEAALDNFKLAVGATVTAPNTITATATEAGYSVGYKDGKYFVKPNIAKIGDTIYGSLKEAIAAAKAGDVITMLQDITEDVTVSKDVTIDGADKTYTGKMTLTSKNGTVAIKNVNFDGKGYNGYAVETRGAYYVTIEDCTAKNYGYGFVQQASATVLTTVKNVTVSNMNYGVKVDYGTDVVLDNVDITVGVAAVLNSNYGEKTVTIKNSKLNILGTWKRNDTTKTNYVFDGENTIETFVIEPTLDNFYLAVDATLTAPNEITMTTDRYYEVKYDEGEGKYFVEAITVELVDGQMTEFINANDIDVKTLTYKRSNIKSTWTPFYVPFAVPVSALADKFDIAYINDVRRTDSDNDGELDDFSMEIIYIHGGNANGSSKILKPNYPYFIRSKVGATEINITLTETTLYAANESVFDCTTMTEKFEIKGNYKQKSDLDKQSDYVVGGGEWGHLATGYSLNPFRFYMTRSSRFENEPASSLPPMKSMKIRVCGEEDENGATIIYDVVEDSLNGNDYIYDLQGRRVSEPKKGGIYIKNGKKILY